METENARVEIIAGIFDTRAPSINQQRRSRVAGGHDAHAQVYGLVVVSRLSHFGHDGKES